MQDYRYKEKLDKIKEKIGKESRYYSKDELEELSKEHEIEIDAVIRDILCRGKEKYIQDFKKVLNKKGEIYFGSLSCSRQFATKHQKLMIEKARKWSESLCSKYKCKYMEQDFASDALVYLLDNCGDVEKNFEDNDEIAKDIIEARIYVFIRYKCLSTLGKPVVDSLYREFTTHKGEREEENTFDRGIEDKTQNVEAKAEEKIMNEIKKKQKKSSQEECIEMLMKNIELGLTREQAIKKTGKMLGISPEVMLKTMQDYLIEQKRVKVTQNGGFILGE